MLANKLKYVIRTGWKELEVSSDRLESVAEHVWGALTLGVVLQSEYDIDVDLLKVFKMIIFKELEKVDLKDSTTRDYPSKDEREKAARETLEKLTCGLLKQSEYFSLVEEYNAGETKEARFAKQLSKIESDLQAKMYDLDGCMDMAVALKDVEYFGEELCSQIKPQMQNASDGFILFDRQYYTDELFKNLSIDVQNLKK